MRRRSRCRAGGGRSNRAASPRAVAEARSAKVIDILPLDIKSPEHEILRATLDAMRRQDAKDDAEKVRRLIDEYRAGGLAVAGLKDTLAALDNGQVDELLLSASLDALPGQGASVSADLSDELVTKAARTSARVTFIEDRALLAPIGGAGALLRYQTIPGGTSMSINVNPGSYKTAGRERPGQDIVPEIQKQNYASSKARLAEAGPETGDGQQSAKAGKRSSVQKQASARRGFEPMPAAAPVPGAIGTRKSGRKRQKA